MTITPQFLMDLETRMRVVSDSAYSRLLSNLWYGNVSVERPSMTAKERIVWLLETSIIRDVGKSGGEVDFDELSAHSKEYENRAAAAGLKLNRYQLEDQDANGVAAAASWAKQMGSYAAYWPQKSIGEAIRSGTVTTGKFGAAYDNLAFFSASHLLDPLDATVGTYSNLHSTLPIDETVTVEAAFENLNTAISNVRAILMPNGVDPRFLRVTALIVPPKLAMRAQILTNAQMIASAASSTGGGGLDVKAVISNWNIGQPVVADELGAAITSPGAGSDTSYYLGVQMMGDEEIGGLTYINREPFSIVYNTGMTDAELARANDLQWTTRGRNTVGYGHPFLLHRVNQA